MLRFVIILTATVFAIALAQAVGINPQEADIYAQHRHSFEKAQGLLKEERTEGAIQILRALAHAEYAPAEAQLGVLYAKGMGVDADESIAAIWFYRAARQGLPSAQLAFGSLLIDGRGVNADLVQAYMWLKLAAERNDGPIADRAEALIAQIKDKMTPDQMAEAISDAQSWKPVHPLPISAGY